MEGQDTPHGGHIDSNRSGVQVIPRHVHIYIYSVQMYVCLERYLFHFTSSICLSCRTFRHWSLEYSRNIFPCHVTGSGFPCRQSSNLLSRVLLLLLNSKWSRKLSWSAAFRAQNRTGVVAHAGSAGGFSIPTRTSSHVSSRARFRPALDDAWDISEADCRKESSTS